MNYESIIKIITDKVLVYFPNTVAIIHWGGAVKRRGFNVNGDADILIVVPDKAEIKTEDLSLLKRSITEIEVDPYVIAEEDLSKDPIVSTGESGQYECHGMIHYQLKNESEVIYGDKIILDLIQPFTIKQALDDIVPYIKDIMIPKVEASLESNDSQTFIENLGDYLMVIIRTIYTCERNGVTNKEEALNYLSDTYPEFLLFSGVLLKRYQKEEVDYTIITKQLLFDFLLRSRNIFESWLNSSHAIKQ